MSDDDDSAALGRALVAAEEAVRHDPGTVLAELTLPVVIPSSVECVRDTGSTREGS